MIPPAYRRNEPGGTLWRRALPILDIYGIYRSIESVYVRTVLFTDEDDAMEQEMEQEFELISLIYQLEEAGYCFADVSDEQLQQAFSDGRDLRDLAVLRSA